MQGSAKKFRTAILAFLPIDSSRHFATGSRYKAPSPVGMQNSPLMAATAIAHLYRKGFARESPLLNVERLRPKIRPESRNRPKAESQYVRVGLQKPRPFVGEARNVCFSLVIDFLAERIEPAANTDTLSESALYADYTAWCRASGRVALAIPEFVGRLRSAACGQRARKNPQAQGSLLRHPPRQLLRKIAATQWVMSRRCALSRSVAARRGLSSRAAAGRAPPRQRRDRIREEEGKPRSRSPACRLVRR